MLVLDGRDSEGHLSSQEEKVGRPPPSRNHKSCTRMEVHQSLLLLLALDTLWAGEHEWETGLEPSLEGSVDGRGGFVYQESRSFFSSPRNGVYKKHMVSKAKP